MGGHALKTVVASRLDRKTFDHVRDRAIGMLAPLKCLAVIEAPGKESFGDIDILCQSGTDIMATLLGSNNTGQSFPEMVKNGNVLSVAWPCPLNDSKFYQVDFISCKDLECAQFYFSYGDLGGILGRMTSFCGIKLGFDGLFVPWFDEARPTQHLFDIFLSSDPSMICKFMGLDYMKWRAGFVTRDAVFEWCSTSTLFDKTAFDRSSMNHANRERAAKRLMFKEFLEFIATKEDRKKQPKMSKIDAVAYFSKTGELNIKLADARRQESIREKFNGRMFVDRGVQGKDVSRLVQQFKSQWTDFDQFVFDSSVSLIQAEIDLVVALDRHVDNID